MAKIDEEKEATLSREIANFKREKERIREIVGKIGSMPTSRKRVINILFGILVFACFFTPLIYGGLHLPMIEFGLLLISIKIIYLLHSHARQMHFMFWILSSVEWRMDEVVRKLKDRDE